jgi:hypothetical protein
MAAARPRLALTSGEPAGIGPDLCVLLAQKLADEDWGCDVTCLVDESVLRARAAQLGVVLVTSDRFRIEHFLRALDGDLCCINLHLGLENAAIGCGLQAVTLQPNDLLAWTALSQMYVRDGNIPEAEAAKGHARILSLGGRVVR